VVPRPLNAWVVKGCPAGDVVALGEGGNDHRRADVQIGLPRRTTSYWSMSGSGLAIAGRVVVLLADVPGDGGVVVVG
jgi:hypothetical protein